jgi:hypothetical protein
MATATLDPRHPRPGSSWLDEESEPKEKRRQRGG